MTVPLTLCAVAVILMTWSGSVSVTAGSGHRRNRHSRGQLQGNERVSRNGGPLLTSHNLPGFKTRITQKGLDFASTLAMDLLMKELKQLEIPDQHHNIGPADVVISGIRVDRFPRPQSSLTPIPSPGYGMRWSATGLSPIIKADWAADIDLGFWVVDKTGSATFTGSNIDFTLDFFISKDGDGRPTTQVQGCDCDGDISLDFEGSLSDILDAGSDIFDDAVRGLVTAKICEQATKEIDSQLGENLHKVPIVKVIANEFLVDLSIVQGPTFYADAVETGIKGVVGLYSLENIHEPPFTPPAIPVRHEDDSRMFYIYLTDYTLNTGLYAAFTDGLLEYTVTPDMVPEEHRGYLNTSCSVGTCLGTIFTELPRLYPNLSAGIDVAASSAPSVIVLDRTINVSADGLADVFVTTADGVKEPLFTIGARINASLEVSLRDKTVVIELTNFDINSTSADVISSSIGEIGTGFFYESIIRVITQEVVMPTLNELGEKGFEIPEMPDIEVVNPIIVDQEAPGVFVFGTDIASDSKRIKKRLFGRRRFKQRKQRKNVNKKRKMAAKKD